MISEDAFEEMFNTLVEKNPGVAEDLIEELMMEADLTRTSTNDEGQPIIIFPSGAELLYVS